jgi:hypothetical protein
MCGINGFNWIDPDLILKMYAVIRNVEYWDGDLDVQ